MRLFPVSDGDGSWPALKVAWKVQCEKFGEDFDDYAVGTFAALDPLAREGHPKAGIYALELSKGEPAVAICQLNRTMLPGYDGMVMRVRFITYAPIYDFGEWSIEDYGIVLTTLFVSILALTGVAAQSARHLKFHLKSAADRQFFQSLKTPLSRIEEFETVEMHGSWLYITKAL